MVKENKTACQGSHRKNRKQDRQFFLNCVNKGSQYDKINEQNHQPIDIDSAGQRQVSYDYVEVYFFRFEKKDQQEIK
jgi:hypothetical protein